MSICHASAPDLAAACDGSGQCRGGRVRLLGERLDEAVRIIRGLFRGDYFNFTGKHYTVERAKLVDLPGRPVPIAIALSGPSSVKLAGEHGDTMVATEPAGELVAAFRRAAGDNKPRYGQLPVCYDTDHSARPRQADAAPPPLDPPTSGDQLRVNLR